jgi:hypothetical protein
MDELQRQGFRSKIFQAHHESKAVVLTVDEAFAVSDALDAAIARAETAEATLAGVREEAADLRSALAMLDSSRLWLGIQENKRAEVQP